MSDVVLTDSTAWKAAKPTLSVLTPFFRYDPIPLLEALDAEGAGLDGAVELVLLDDGGGDDALAEAVAAKVKALALPVRFVRLLQNEGRAKGRNRLAGAARARHLLFLDCDMLPDGSGFLAAYLEVIAQGDPPVVFGGFAAPSGPVPVDQAVAKAMALSGDCASAAARQLQPEKYVFTSNLLVRRDVFEAEAFDPGFTGWGWEDVEWAMRVSRRFRVVHLDNAATHMGLDTVASLAGKYEQSAPNFARMAERHPAIVAAYPSYRAARLLKRLPGLPGLRRMMRRGAETGWLPVAARAFSLRLYRAALYADAV